MTPYTELTPGISFDIMVYIPSYVRLAKAMEHYISVISDYLKKYTYIK